MEAMLRLDESISISPKDIADKGYIPILPIEIQYANAAGREWKPLEQIQTQLRIPWIGKKAEWQSIKTLYEPIPVSLDARMIRLILRGYSWKKQNDPNKIVRCAVSFDEIKIFVCQ